MRENIGNRKGISLLILIITIIVLLILVTITIVSVNDSINKGRLAGFAEDISNVQDAVELYYIQNSDFPLINGSNEMTQQDILALSGSENEATLQDEMRLNGDLATGENVGTYYKIDLGKINVKTTNRGTQKKPNDVYVVSYPSMNVYYVAGIKVKGVRYFSLTSKIANVENIVTNPNGDNSQTTIQTVSGVTVKKTTKLWTNKMGISIQANMEAGESLYLVIAGGSKKQITTVTGNNVFSFDSLLDIVQGRANIQVAGLTVADDTTFQSLAQNAKNIEITKEKGGAETARIKVDLSNYETQGPTLNGSAVITSKETYNLVSLDTSDILSGIKEVRYDYLSKYDDTGAIKDYYNGLTVLDDNYIKSNGKLASVSKTGHVEIKVPKNVQKIQIAAVDKAGNISKTADNKANTQVITVPLYVGIVPTATTKTSIKFNLVFNSASGINIATASVSADNVNYNKSQDFTINSTNTTIVQEVNFTDIANVTDRIYVKAKATDKNGKTETISVAVDWKDNFVIDNDNPGGIVGNVYTDSTGKKATIPQGFTVSNVETEKNIDTGLVVKDSKGNEFVWIPVDFTDDANFATTFIRKVGYYNGSVQTNYPFEYCTEPYSSAIQEEKDEYTKMVESVKKYKGYYIARYEASQDASDNAQSKPNTAPWVNITWGSSMTNLTGGSVEKARAMYPEATATEGSAVTTLIYGVQWDVALDFIENYGVKNTTYRINSTGNGNYGVSAAINTGSNEAFQFNNIYDMAGNVYEWTMEAYNARRVYRGGRFTGSGLNNPVSYRANSTSNYTLDGIGFRVALYIK